MNTNTKPMKVFVTMILTAIVSVSCAAQNRTPTTTTQDRSARQATTPSKVEETTKVLTVDSVFNKYYEATGGKEKWDQIKTYSLNRKYVSQNVASYDAEIRGTLIENALYKNEIIKGRGFVYGIKGTDAWRKVPLGSSDKVTKYQVSNLSEDKAADMRLELYDFLVPFLKYKERGFIATLVGADNFKGKTVQKVELQGKEGRYTLLFDDVTGLLLQSRLLAGGEEIISDYDKYVKSDYGVFYPSSIARSEVKRKATYKITSKLTINGNLDSSLFKR